MDEKHELTGWGKVLAALTSANATFPEDNDVAILSVELLRLDLLNSNNMFPMYTGYPLHGSG